MIRIRSTGCFAGVLALALTAGPIAGQSAAADPAQPESDTVPEPVKKKGGLFGKVKGLAGNKVVQTVAKTAACTMLPGGQAIAGAIDTASSKSVGEAAAGAAGAAAGTGCLPGMGGAGPVGGMAGAAAAGLAGSVPAGYAPDMPAATSGDAGPYGGMEEMARCLGFTTEEFLALGRQAGIGQKVDLARYRSCAMQQMKGE